MGRIALALMLVAAAARTTAAQEACPLPGQTRMLVAELFLGRASPKGEVSEEAWRAFLRTEATPRFPAGLTAFDAYGQWQDPATKKIGRERTKVLLIAIDDTDAARQKLEDLAAAWRNEFAQKSVGILAHTECASF
jgi:transposase